MTHVSELPTDSSSKLRSVGRLRFWFRRAFRVVAWGAGLLMAIVVIGLIPVNNDFEPAVAGVEIFVTSNSVHAEIVVPVNHSVMNWREFFPDDDFSGDTSQATHAAIGWGDRSFFLETPTWSDLKFSTAFNAAFRPSETSVHVTMKDHVQTGPSTRSVRISEEQYANLVKNLQQSLGRHHGAPVRLDASYGQRDMFYEATGSYHALNTCNSWCGRMLQSAGIRVGWSTPLPKTVFLYLPKPNEHLE